jgi:hypothetical protein
LAINPIVNLINFERSVSGLNTRTLAKQWIENNIPSGAKILMDTGKSINTFGPKIAGNKKSIERILDIQHQALKNNNKSQLRGLVTKDSLIYYKLLLESVPQKSYDITSTMFGTRVETIDYYIAEKFGYFIISKNMKERAKEELFRNRFPEVSRFYESLEYDPRIKLIKTVSPTPKNKGLTYYIYKLSTA